MALVRITERLVSGICAKLNAMYNADYAKVSVIEHIPPAVGDAIYELCLPSVVEEKITALAPNWLLNRVEKLLVSYAGKQTLVPLSRKRIEIVSVKKTIIRNASGFETIRVGRDIVLTVSNFDDITDKQLKDFLIQVQTQVDTQNSILTEARKAQQDMRKFLCQRTTLQAAMKDFGPALWKFVPDTYKQQYEKVHGGKEKPVKKEHSDVDVSGIIAKITAKHLDLGE